MALRAEGVYGYGNQELIDATSEQMHKLTFTHRFGGKTHQPGMELVDKLAAMMTFAKQLSSAYYPISASVIRGDIYQARVEPSAQVDEIMERLKVSLAETLDYVQQQGLLVA